MEVRALFGRFVELWPNWGRANKMTLLPLIRLQNKVVTTLEYNKTKTTVLYSKHKIL